MARQLITYPCATCGLAFALNPYQSAKVRKNPAASVYCSRKCAGVSAAAPLVCGFCKQAFNATGEQRRSQRHGHRVYCSTAHYQADRVTYVCNGCKSVFVTTAYERRLFSKNYDVCCAKCRAAAKAA